MSPVLAIEHPLVHHYVTQLRDVNTSAEEFRTLVRRLSSLLAFEATTDLLLETQRVVTPVAESDGATLCQRLGIVPILRAGLGMVDAMLDLLPTAEVWHLGLYRDESTAQPVEYYQKLPATEPVDVALVLDPMLATGGSASVAIRALKDWGVETIKVCAMIASEPGIAEVRGQFPDIQIYVCAIDPILNDAKFIVPGLGDAGDRSFNTRP